MCKSIFNLFLNKYIEKSLKNRIKLRITEQDYFIKIHVAKF